MVAVVAGGMLGLNTGSALVLGRAGVAGSANLGRAGDRVYVNAATGNLVVQALDETLSGRGPDALGLRTYNSLGNFSDDNGDNWLPGLARKVYQLTGTVNTAGSTVTRRDEDGSEVVFSWDASKACYLSSEGAGAHDTLSYNAASAVWTYVEGSTRQIETYSANAGGRLTSVADASGNALSFSYNAANLISAVSTAAGEVSYYDYNASNQLTQIRTAYKSSAAASGLDKTLTRVRYGYDASNRLQTVSVDLSPEDNAVADGKTFTTSYTYDGASKRVASITQSDGSKISFTYVLVNNAYRVQNTTDALGGLTSFAYDTVNRITTVTDPLGLVTTYRFDAQNRLTQISAPPVGGVASTSAFEYNANGDVTKITDAEGRAATMAYDAWGNLTRETSAANSIVLRSYNSANQLLTETIAVAGEPPANTAASRYIYDATGVRLRFSISAEGRVSEYQYNAQGQRTSAIQYAAALYNVAGWASTSVPSEADVQNWVNTQDKTRTQRQDYQYDWQGQLATQTTYASVGANGAGIADGNQSTTQYIYNPQGMLLKTVDAKSGVTQYTYDGLGRVLSTTNALNQVSTTAYDDAGGQVRTTAANGLVTTSTYDKLGRLSASVQYSNAQMPSGWATDGAMAVDGSTVSKTSNGINNWDASVRSTYGYVGGASVSFNPAQNNNYLMVGLNTDPATDGSFGSIDWAMYCAADGVVYVYESGSWIGSYGSYNAGDAFSVTYDGQAIRYIKNGTVLRSVNTTITQPLYMDTSFYTPNAKVSNLKFEALSPSAAAGYQLNGVTLDAGAISKPGADGWNTAASSKVGMVGAATVSFRPAQNDKYLMVGLNTDPNTDDSYGSIDWALYCIADGSLQVYESGNPRGVIGSYSAGDNLSVTYDGQAVRYVKNGTVLRTVAATITQPLYADSSFFSTGAKVLDMTLSAGPVLAAAQNFYDADNRLRMTQEAGGARHWYYYDEASRKVGEVDALGLLTEYVYNKAGQLTQTIAYATQVNTPSLVDAAGKPSALTLANIRPVASAADRKSWNAYDPAGRLVKSVSPLGEVSELTYDAAGRVLITRRYANAISTNALGSAPSPSSIAPTASSADQLQRTFYDNDSLAVGSMDATGAVQENQYDAAGRLQAKTQRVTSATAAQLSLAQNAATTLAQVRPADVANDLKGLNFYNAKGQLVGQLDGEGDFAETVYDLNGNVANTLRYSVKTSGYNANSTLANVRAAAGSVLNNTQYDYDALNRVLKQRVDPAGLNLTTTYVFDDAGNRLLSTNPNGTLTLTQYDAKGRVLCTKVDPSGLNIVTRYTYDVQGRVATSTDANGVLTQYTYDALGRKQTVTLDPAGLNLTTTYAYDKQGNLARSTDPKGKSRATSTTRTTG